MTLTLGFSPCPNDCFMFDAIVNRRIDLEGLEFDVRLADVEALNTAAFAGDVDVTKLSYHAYAYCADDYVLLDAGSALGRNCGPLLISKRAISGSEVAVGRTAHRDSGQVHDRELPAWPRVSSGAATRPSCCFRTSRARCSTAAFDAGLIIHENRFTYAAKGLKKIIDLGEFWEAETGAPIPLGGIVVRRSLAGRRASRRSIACCVAAWSMRSRTATRACRLFASMRRR